MIDPELAALVDVLPVIELDDMQVARDAFEQLIASFNADIPGIESLEIEDRLVPRASEPRRVRVCVSWAPLSKHRGSLGVPQSPSWIY